MNGYDFYEEFKNSLAFLGLTWGDKACVKVSTKGDSIIFSYGNKSARIVVGSAYRSRQRGERKGKRK